MPLPITIRFTRQPSSNTWSFNGSSFQEGGSTYDLYDLSGQSGLPAEDAISDISYQAILTTGAVRADDTNFLQIGFANLFIFDNDFNFYTASNIRFAALIETNSHITITTNTAVTIYDDDGFTDRTPGSYGLNITADAFAAISSLPGGSYLDVRITQNQTTLNGGIGSLAITGEAEVDVNLPVPTWIGSSGGDDLGRFVYTFFSKNGGSSFWLNGVDTRFGLQITAQLDSGVYSSIFLVGLDSILVGLSVDVALPAGEVVFSGTMNAASAHGLQSYRFILTEAQYNTLRGTDPDNPGNRILHFYRPPTSVETPSLIVGAETALDVQRVSPVRIGGERRRNVLSLVMTQRVPHPTWSLSPRGPDGIGLTSSPPPRLVVAGFIPLRLTLLPFRFEIIHPTTGVVFDGLLSDYPSSTAVEITQAQYDAIYGPSTDVNNLDNRTITIYLPDSTETPSGAIGGASAIGVIGTTPVRLAGIGTLAFGGDSYLDISSILQQLPVTVVLNRTGGNTWQSVAADTEQKLFKGAAAGRTITATRTGNRLRLSITGNVDFDDDVEDSDVLFALYDENDTYILFRDVTGASHTNDHPYDFQMTNAERNLVRDANSASDDLYLVFQRPDPIYVPAAVPDADLTVASAVTVTVPAPVRFGGIGSEPVNVESALAVTRVAPVRVGGQPRQEIVELVLDFDTAGSDVGNNEFYWSVTIDGTTHEIIRLQKFDPQGPWIFLGSFVDQYGSDFLRRFSIIRPGIGVVYDAILAGSINSRGARISEAQYNAIRGDPDNPGSRTLNIYDPDNVPALAFDGESGVAAVGPTAVRIEGIGSLAVGGESASPQVGRAGAVRLGGIGSLAWTSDSALGVTRPTAVRLAGIGSLAVGGAGAVTVEASTIPIPDVVAVAGGTGEITFGDYRIQWSSGFRETYRFRTSIIESRSGVEQRIANRSRPRVDYEFTAFLDPVELRAFTERASRDQGHLDFIPHPRDTVAAPIEIGAGTNFIPFDPVPPWLIAGSRIFTRFGQYVLPGAVLGVSPEGALLVFSNPSPIPAGVKIFRGAPVRPSASPAISAATSRSGSMSVRADGDPVDNWLPDWPALPPDILDGKEYFNLPPNWSDGVQLSIPESWEDVDFNRGAVSRLFPKSFPTRLLRFGYLLSTPARIEHVLGLFNRVRGRQQSFWMPSHIHEIQPSKDLTRRRLTVAGGTFAEVYAERTVFRWIRILHVAGQYTAEVDTIEENADGDSVITFVSRLPASLTVDEIRMVSWINLVRFETDALTLDWMTDGVAETTLNVRTVETELPTSGA